MTTQLVRSAVEDLMRAQAASVTQMENASREERRRFDAMLRDIVEIADSIERLRWNAPAESADMLGALHDQTHEVLIGLGLAVFRPSIGDTVDGRTCEVMATVSSPGLRAGAITRNLRAGYQAGDRIVRRAGVEVVKE